MKKPKVIKKAKKAGGVSLGKARDESPSIGTPKIPTQKRTPRETVSGDNIGSVTTRKKIDSALVKEGQKLRMQAARRIRRLEIASNNEKVSNYTRNNAKMKAERLQEVADATRIVKGRTEEEQRKLVDTLQNEVSSVNARYTAEGDPFEVTSRELSRATSKAADSSVYSRTEAKAFYKVTEKVWRKENVITNDRNAAILNDINERRAELGLSPLTLDEAIRDVLDVNQNKIFEQKLDPSKPMTEEEKEAMERAQQGDTTDEDHYAEEFTYIELITDLQNLWAYREAITKMV